MIVDEKVNNSDYYSVGYCPELRKYIITITTTDHTTQYNRYFEITKYEYIDFESLSWLADELVEKGPTSDRFLYSEKSNENTVETTRYKKFFESYLQS